MRFKRIACGILADLGGLLYLLRASNRDAGLRMVAKYRARITGLDAGYRTNLMPIRWATATSGAVRERGGRRRTRWVSN